MVGYHANGYKVFNPENGGFGIVRDVYFDETNFLKTRPHSRNEIRFKDLTITKHTNNSDGKNKNVKNPVISDETNPSM